MPMIYHYTPSKMSPADLKSMFISRKGRSVFDRILKDLKKRIDKSSNQHYLILGPRGIGKSHLLANLYYAVKEDTSLNSYWIPLWFAEEEYAVSSIRDLVDRVLEEIAHEFSVEKNKLIVEISAFKGEMAQNDDNDAVFNLTTAFIKDLGNKVGKRFIVITENFNMFLKDISSYEEKKLRAFLMNETSLLFIASAPTLHSYLKDVADPENALYNLFDVHYLEEFNFEECRELLRQQCLLDKNTRLCDMLESGARKFEIFHRLAGGNPRLMLMFYQLTAFEKSLPEIEKTFAQLLEKLTPYFQSRMENLSSQQRKILLAFAQRLENLTPAEVGRGIHLPTNQVTAQLKKLVEYGFLGIVAKEGEKRGTLYELSERIYRYWYQSRTGRGRNVIAGLVEFISEWFSIDELKNLEIEWTKKLRFSIDSEEQKAAKKKLAYIAQSMRNKYRTYVSRGMELFQSAKYNEALECLNRAINIIPTNGNDYNLKGVCLDKLGKHNEAIECFDKAINLMPGNAGAYNNKGTVLSDIGQYEAAIECYDHSIDIIPIPGTYYNKGNALLFLGRFEEAFQCYEKATDLKPDFIDAYNDKGAVLSILKRYKEAVRTHNKAIEIKPNLPHAYYNKAAALAGMGKLEEAIKCYNKVIELDPGNFKPYLWLSICESELKQKTDSLYHFEKGLDLFFSKEKGNDISILRDYIYKALSTGDYSFVESIIGTIEKKKTGLDNEYNFEFLRYFKILIEFLKTGDKDILDRQPTEIRETLKEMIDSLNKQTNKPNV